MTKEDVYRWVGKRSVEAGYFIKETGKDFAEAWQHYPNVLIWCGVAFLIAVFV